MKQFVTLALLVACVQSQIIEQRSSVKNPDGSTTHHTQRSFSHATYSEENQGPGGVVAGRTVYRDSTGKNYGNEWKTGNDGKIEQRKLEGADAALPAGAVGDGVGIGGRSILGGLGTGGLGGLGTGLGSGLHTGFGVPDYSQQFGSVGGGYDAGFAPQVHQTSFGGGFGSVGSGGQPGYANSQGSYHVDPVTGRRSYSYSSSSGHSTSSNTGY